MKKSYLMIAAAAGLMLTACSQEDDFVAQNAAAEQGDGAVLFDTYLSNNSTRAGQTGTMTTTTLQQTGFGITAFTHSVATGDGYENKKSSTLPNFMWNQYVGYEASNWTYNPLKYWPNETQETTLAATDKGAGNTATSENTEGVSFFAYAPYVKETSDKESTTETPGKYFIKLDETAGILGISDNAQKDDPRIHYKVAKGDDATNQPSKSVDLLWGTSSGFAYHPVRTAEAVVTAPGKPVIDMTKPAIDEKIKFDFKHALARIGMTVVGAFDQKAAGGKLDQNTAVTIKSITVTGKFQTEGYLNLNNTDAGADRAYWQEWSTTETKWIDMTSPGTAETFSISYNGEMNPNLIYQGSTAYPTVMGVSQNEQSVIAINNKPDWNKVAANFTKIHFDAFHKVDGTTYYKETSGTYSVVAPLYNTADKLYTFDGVKYTNKATHPAANDIDGTTYYAITKKSDGKAGSAITADQWEGNTWYEYDTSSEVFTVADTKDNAKTYFTTANMNITVADLGYAGDTDPAKGNYYTFNPTPGYFMVIPAKKYAEKENLVVDVTIDYVVTTRDPNLKDASNNKTSQVENIISQNVTLSNFTNGKAYNLKLILGLTSVKVEAEVSNWEVETVESNLPLNRD